MKKTIDGIIACCGMDLVLMKAQGAVSIRALLQVMRSKSQDNVQRAFGPLGEVPKGGYVLIAPMEPTVEVGDELRWGARLFDVRRAEPMMYGNEALYIWGLCVEKGGGDEWGA